MSMQRSERERRERLERKRLARERLERKRLAREGLIKNLEDARKQIKDINTGKSIAAMYELQKIYRQEERQSIIALSEHFIQLKANMEQLQEALKKKVDGDKIKPFLKRLYEQLRRFEKKIKFKQGTLDNRMKVLEQTIKELQEAIEAIEGADALTKLNPKKRPRRQLKL